MRYRLRTLMILLAVGPPVIAGVWLFWSAFALGAAELFIRLTAGDTFP